MTTQAEIAQKAHRRAVRFFWRFLIGATVVSLVGNIAHAVMPYIPPVAIQIGAAAVPPIVLLAAVHGIALAVRAGASGRIYLWAVGAVAIIGVGAFALSFLALRDLMQAIGYNSPTAWVFPVIIDTTIAVSTMMLVALGDKPVRRTRAGAPITSPPHASSPPQPHPARADRLAASAKSAPAQPARRAFVPSDAGADRAALAQELVDAGATTKPASMVATILSAHAGGTALNRIASEVGVHHKTVARIIDAADAHVQQHLVAV